MQSPHILAYQGNLLALQAMPIDPLFHTRNERGQTVLYTACISPNTSPELVAHLIDCKQCDVNMANDHVPGCGSLPQHAVVQSLRREVIGQMTPSQPAPPPLTYALLGILNVLRTKGANMSLANTLYQHTALQEFQMFQQQMMSFPALAHLVPRFVQALTPLALPTTPVGV
jgi:hypothetical protein